jgi:NADPH:quinone reductase
MMMRAVIGETLGAPEVYQLVERPVPQPGPNDVRLKICVTSLGYADGLLAAGLYQIKPPLPFTPGTEVAGIIDAVGADVARWSVGDRVTAGSFGGGLAEFLCVDAAQICALPSGISFAQGACFRSNYATAYHALHDRAQIKSGETLLVLGAAGGVGIAAVQLGKALGATVIAAASNEMKRNFAIQHGADKVVDYTVDNWRDTLKSLTNGDGVDVVFDPVGGDKLEPAFRSLAWGGRYLVIGFAGGDIPKLPVNLPLLKGASLVGVDIRQFGMRQPQAERANDLIIHELAARGAINPPVGTCFEFDDFRLALAASTSGEALGKIVVTVAGRNAL